MHRTDIHPNVDHSDFEFIFNLGNRLIVAEDLHHLSVVQFKDTEYHHQIELQFPALIGLERSQLPDSILKQILCVLSLKIYLSEHVVHRKFER